MKSQSTITDPQHLIQLPLDFECPDRLNSTLDMSWLADCLQQESDSMREEMLALAPNSESSISSNDISNETSKHMQGQGELVLPSADLSALLAAVSHLLGAERNRHAGERGGCVSEAEMLNHSDLGSQRGSSVGEPIDLLVTRGQGRNSEVY